MAISASNQNEIYLSSSPHYANPLSTKKIMLSMVIALLPIAVLGVVFFGMPALITIVVSVVSCVVFEAVFKLITKQKVRIGDFSAVISGLLLALVLPPSTPWWMTVLGALFAIVVAKEFFGGIGANVFNPALAGRAFMLMSFTSPLTTWISPVDAVTTATPLALIKEGTFIPETATYLELFLGNRAGSIGETSILLILIMFILLTAVKIIDWRAPVAMVVTTVAISFLLGRDPLLTVLTGGLVFGAVFMTTDYSTTPVTKTGRILFGCGCGIITSVIRVFGGYPEGVMFSILIMNALVPFLDRFIPKKYGFTSAKKEKAAK